MAKKPKGSKYAAKLHELGFEPVNEGMEAYKARRIERRVEQLLGRPISSLSRRERRLMKKETRKPGFIVFGGENPSINLTDELGRSWRKAGTINPHKLTVLGFKNNTLEAAINSLVMPPLPPEKT